MLNRQAATEHGDNAATMSPAHELNPGFATCGIRAG